MKKITFAYSFLFFASACGGSSSAVAPPSPTAELRPGATQLSSLADQASLAALPVCEPVNGTGPDAEPVSSGVSQGSVLVMGTPRTYTLSAPASRPSALPLIFVFNDAHSTGSEIRDRLALELPAQGRAIFVYPDGDKIAHSAWDSQSAAADNSDLQFFDALLAKLTNQFCVSWVFAAGHGDGGTFDNYLGCQRGDQLRAIAPEYGQFDFFDGAVTNGRGRVICPTSAISAFLIESGEAPEAHIWQNYDFQHWTYWNQLEGDRDNYNLTTFDPPGCVAAEAEPLDHQVLGCTIPGLKDAIWPSQAQMVWDYFSTFK